MAGIAYADPAALFGTALPKVASPRRCSRFGDLVLLAFLLAQFLDGIFTYVGVATFGIAAEANPIIAGLMTHLGHGIGLTGAKIVAGALGIGLHLREIHGAVALLAGFYLTVAVGPWTMILFF